MNGSPDINDIFIETLSQQQKYMQQKMENPKVIASTPDSPMMSYFKYMRTTLKGLDVDNQKRIFKKLRLSFEDAMDDIP